MRQKGLDDLVLQLSTLLVVDLAGLAGLDLIDLVLHLVAHNAPRQNSLVSAHAHEHVTISSDHERAVLVVAERGAGNRPLLALGF